MRLSEGRLALAAGILVHLLFIASIPTHFLNPLFIEAVHVTGQAGDYYGIYQAGDNLVHGYSIYDSYDYRNEAQRRVPFFYFYRYLPPTAYVAALSSLVLSPKAGYVVWVIVNELLMAAMAVWILRLRAYRIRERRIYAALWLGFTPFYLEQYMGQFSVLMSVFLWIMMREGMPDRGAESRPPSGVAFWAWTASVVLKSFPALFAIPYALRRWWRPILLCAVTVIAVSAPYYIFRPADLGQFIHLNFRTFAPKIHGGALGAATLFRRFGWYLPHSISEREVGFGPFRAAVGNLPVLLANLVIFTTSLGWSWRYRRKADTNLHLSLWTLVFFLYFQDLWESHYLMLLPVVTALGLARGSRFVLAMGILLALPTPFVIFAKPDHSLGMRGDLLNHAVKPVPTLALWIWVLREMARPSSRARWEAHPEQGRLAASTPR